LTIKNAAHEAAFFRHCEEAEGRRGNPEASRDIWIASLRSQ
jgi:hypothetical protein